MKKLQEVNEKEVHCQKKIEISMRTEKITTVLFRAYTWDSPWMMISGIPSGNKIT